MRYGVAMELQMWASFRSNAKHDGIGQHLVDKKGLSTQHLYVEKVEEVE